jgi:arylsulfatase A-like enzyme
MFRLVMVVALALMAAAASADERPNVILILSDDQRYDTIRALGNDEIQTPNLDRLVTQGAAFENTYIMGSLQPAVCVCSRACLMSGRSLFRAPANLAKTPLLPRLLADAGVHTYGIGKWHNGEASYARAFDDGAAVFFGGMHDHARIPVFAFDKAGRYPKAAQQIGKTFSTELFADNAIDFLKKYREDAPFFLYVALTAPHDPRTPPGKYKTMYDPAKLSLPKNFLPEHPFDNGELKVRDELLAPLPRTPAVIREHLADYYGMISHLDEQVGRITDALAASPHAKKTIVVFASDNGLAVGQHGLLGKQSLYEHSMRVPLVMAGLGIKAKQRISAPVYLFDLFTTIGQWQRAKLPKDVDSRDLTPLLEGKEVEDRVIFGAYRDVQRMVRSGDLKLIICQQTKQLFNLRDDPWERTNLADPFDPKDRQFLRMLDKMQEAQRRYGDTKVSF